ncbi:hypothetical protein HYV82_01450 [Candidatus Woesearchaeota archaeon]|nr:hypothetical protein [Candidatus Woesearchaeota archaeon]
MGRTGSNIEELLAGGGVTVTRGQTRLTYEELAGMAAEGLEGCQVTAGNTRTRAHIDTVTLIQDVTAGTILYAVVSYTGGPIMRTSGPLNSHDALGFLGRVYETMNRQR